jgi:glutamine amidotransferase
MCRLFFLWDGGGGGGDKTNENMQRRKEKIMEFMKQSTHLHKWTPQVHNEYEKARHVDGYGFAWWNHNAWSIHKSPVVFTKDSAWQQVLTKMTTTESNMILGHLRNKTNPAKRSMKNTHPFVLDDKVFFHNGVIRDFEKHRTTLQKMLHKKYHLQGTTDSEMLFFILLSKMETATTTTSVKWRQLVQNMLEELQGHGIHGLFNFLYADKRRVLVTRYSTIPKWKAPSLYFQWSTPTMIVISSEPVGSEYTLVPEQSIMVFNR